MWIKSIAFPRSLFSGGLFSVEQRGSISILCFNDFDTKETTKVYWQTSVLTPKKGRKAIENVVIPFMCIFLLGYGCCNNE